MNRSSGSTRASRARRSEEWQVSNVSSEGNKNEVDSEDESDTPEDRLVIDETPEVDPMLEAKMVREEMAELKAKMDEEGRRAEEESKKKLAEMKAQAAKRKAERKAKQEERRRQMEAEKESSSGESDSTLVNAHENEDPENTLINDKTVTIEQKNPKRRSMASIPVPNFESENQGRSSNPLETSNISNFDPAKISTPKPSPMPSATEVTESTANDGLGIQTSQTYQTQEKILNFFIVYF